MTTNARPVPSKEWEDILEKGDNFRHLRWLFRWLPHDPRCELCLAPFAGIGGTMVRTFKGIKPSTLNPHYCNDCELVSKDHPGGAEADVALLFADIRGSTALAETMEPADYSAIVSRYFSEASHVLIHAGALIDNLAGDGVNAIFARGFAGDDYVRKAIDAARRLLEITGHGGGQEPWVPIGVGVALGAGVRRRCWERRAARDDYGARRLRQRRCTARFGRKQRRGRHKRGGLPAG